jgi:hypothetical protein
LGIAKTLSKRECYAKNYICEYLNNVKIEMEIYHSGRRKSPSSCGKALQSRLSAGKTMGSERK